MSSKYESLRERLDNLAEGIQSDADTDEVEAKADAEALDVAGDALAFIEVLWASMGEDPEETPDMSKMENLYDAFQGELAAAALFLSENTFARVPDMLRAIADDMEKKNDGSTPVVIQKGFKRFAARIEHTRKMKQQYIGMLKKMPKTEETA